MPLPIVVVLFPALVVNLASGRWFFPPVATKLTQSPWFLNIGLSSAFLNVFQPSSLHSSLSVGDVTDVVPG
jgi:hypothetical protein